MSNELIPTSGNRRLVTTYREGRQVIQTDGDGFIQMRVTDVRLDFGTDLYSIRRSPSADDPVHIWGSGPSKIVAAMGGRLEPLHRSVDPVTGEARPGKRVTRDPDTGIVMMIECDAICAVRHPSTGEWTGVVATAVEDLSHLLRLELAKLASDRDDAPVRMIVGSAVEAARKAGNWIVIPYAIGGVFLAGDLRKGAVRTALETVSKMSDLKVLSGRIESKAMRRAFLANGALRQWGSFQYGQLAAPRDANGNQIGPPGIVIPVPCAVRYEHRADVEKVLEALVIHGEFQAAPMDDEPAMLEQQDEYTEPEAASREPVARAVLNEGPTDEGLRRIAEERPDAKVTLRGGTLHEVVEAPAVDQATIDRLLVQIEEWEGDVGDIDAADCRERAGLATGVPIDSLTDNLAGLKRYLAELQKIGGM